MDYLEDMKHGISTVTPTNISDEDEKAEWSHIKTQDNLDRKVCESLEKGSNENQEHSTYENEKVAADLSNLEETIYEKDVMAIISKPDEEPNNNKISKPEEILISEQVLTSNELILASEEITESNESLLLDKKSKTEDMSIAGEIMKDEESTVSQILQSPEVSKTEDSKAELDTNQQQKETAVHKQAEEAKKRFLRSSKWILNWDIEVNICEVEPRYLEEHFETFPESFDDKYKLFNLYPKMMHYWDRLMLIIYLKWMKSHFSLMPEMDEQYIRSILQNISMPPEWKKLNMSNSEAVKNKSKQLQKFTKLEKELAPFVGCIGYAKKNDANKSFSFEDLWQWYLENNGEMAAMYQHIETFPTDFSDKYLQYSKMLYCAGKIQDACSFLYHYMDMIYEFTSGEKRELKRLSAMWGIVGCHISTLVERMNKKNAYMRLKIELNEGTLKDPMVTVVSILKLDEMLEAYYTSACNLLSSESPQIEKKRLQYAHRQTQMWLIHWALWPLFKYYYQEHLYECWIELSEWFYKNIRLVTAVCPHLLRYYAAICIFGTNRKDHVSSLCQAIQSIDLLIKAADPLVVIIKYLFIDVNLKQASLLIPDIEVVCEVDYFLESIKTKMLDKIRMTIFKRICRTHSSINIDVLAQYLQMPKEETVNWVSDNFQSDKIDANIKADWDTGLIQIPRRKLTPYEQVRASTEGLITSILKKTERGRQRRVTSA